MRTLIRVSTAGLLAMVALIMLLPATALASSGPARVTTVAAGPYIIDVQFSQDPPFVDQPFTITIVPHESGLQLTGSVTSEPGLGTDATNMHWALAPVPGHADTLQTSIHIPVKGAWNLVIDLKGASGNGEATVGTTVGAPGAMPFWLAWLIGSCPLIFILFWILHQHRYRNKLQVKEAA